MTKITWTILSIVFAFSGIFWQQTNSSTCIHFRRFLNTGKLNLKGLLTFSFRSIAFVNCSTTCYYDTSCSFFSFNDQTGVCSGYLAIAEGTWESKLTLPITGVAFHQGPNGTYVNDSVSGLIIRILNEWYTYADAQKECLKKGERLVALDTPEKRQRITTLIEILVMVDTRRNVNKYWTGLTYNSSKGSWLWNSETPLGDVSPLKTRLDEDDKDCGSIYQKNILIDWDCMDRIPPICEKY